MGIRKIVSINEEKCTGCGVCIIDCHEGALQIVDGKAKIVNDVYCDGLGDCLKGCPEDAITIIEREAVDFSEEAVKIHLENKKKASIPKMEQAPKRHFGGCPSSRSINLDSKDSALTQWPVQLTLLNPAAPYLKNADLLVTADCVPFAYKSYHEDFLKGRKLAVGCPKLDNVESYIEKLTEIIEVNELKSITVLKMEVPCCQGIARAVEMAREASGIEIEINLVTVSINGEILGREVV
ncbi:ATP-binding protein [Clostridium cylindrosporum]|uniref:4Fe-4S ferredoxin iron-sulfur binding domain protein n=1 Tax=Clostridium cylindrosporum DSM 605 TaxID=1121307 RepID=A0A0J8DAI2_CLOCY|nr:4Fe-4S dicluster domain-containing protein [Clostridium cylindrosporum]KMT22857.1 4Fe-4S ferredoxin iron-sulfur binding domain protein [Clostridium cylindrosporum DSM 605]